MFVEIGRIKATLSHKHAFGIEDLKSYKMKKLCKTWTRWFLVSDTAI